MKKFLFVCTANTCRSPMAEGIFNKLAKEKKLDLESASAGIYASKGNEASKFSIESMKKEGVDISNHQSQILTNELINEYDVILAMTLSHKKEITTMFPEFESKIFTIAEYAKNSSDINDPFGGNLDVYIENYKKIEEYIKIIIDAECDSK